MIGYSNHPQIMRSKTLLNSSREVARGCEVSFVKCHYLESLIIGQNLYYLWYQGNQTLHRLASAILVFLLLLDACARCCVHLHLFFLCERETKCDVYTQSEHGDHRMGADPSIIDRDRGQGRTTTQKA